MIEIKLKLITDAMNLPLPLSDIILKSSKSTSDPSTYFGVMAILIILLLVNCVEFIFNS